MFSNILRIWLILSSSILVPNERGNVSDFKPLSVRGFGYFGTVDWMHVKCYMYISIFCQKIWRNRQPLPFPVDFGLHSITRASGFGILSVRSSPLIDSRRCVLRMVQNQSL